MYFNNISPYISLSSEAFLSDSKVVSFFVTGEPLLLKIRVLKWTVIKFKCFSCSFPNAQIGVFCFHNKVKQSFSIHQKLFWILSTWVTAAFFQAKQRALGKALKKYFRRKRMDREFWRFDGSPVALKFCDIRIMSVKCLDCLIWLKKFSRIRGKFQKCYLPNISDSKIRQSLPGSNIWNTFAKKITFCENNFFHSFYYLLPVLTLVLVAISSL